MVGTMTAAKQPEWMDSGRAEDMVDVQSLLERYQLLFRKLRAHAVEKSDNIYKILNGFGDTQLEALGSLFYSLERALFKSPATISGPRITGQHYLIEYVPSRNVVDFAQYIHTNFEDTSKVSFPGQDAAINFFVEWISRLREILDGGVVGLANAGVDDLIISNTPSESTALKHWRGLLDDGLSTFQRTLGEKAARDSAIQSAFDAQQAANAARRAAGQAGAISMGQHFKQIADEEAKSEKYWNISLFVLVAAILGMSGFIVYHSVYAQWVQTLLHLIIVLPVIGAATYASKIANHHRVVARWAKTASVQVNSIQAFAEQLGSHENRDRLILTLGENVFSAPTYAESSRSDHFSAIPADVVAALKELAKKPMPGTG
jgi:hypothetical protein